MNRHSILLLAGLALAAGTGRAAAQAAGPQPAPPPALVALVSQQPDTAPRIVVWRRAVGQPADVIVLREEDATPDDLAAGIALLARSRAMDGDTLQATLRMRVRSAAPLGRAPSGLADRLGETLRRIRREPVRDVPGVGPARSGTIPMAPFRHRGS